MFRQTTPCQDVPTVQNGYQNNYQNGYQQEYQEYAQGPNQAQGPPVQHQHQPSLNPFVAPPAPSSLAQTNAQKKKSKTKRHESSTSAAPMVPQPLGNVAPAPMASSTPLVSNQNVLVPPGHKWVLEADGPHATIPPAPAPPASLEVVNVEPEPVKVDAGLKTA